MTPLLFNSSTEFLRLQKKSIKSFLYASLDMLTLFYRLFYITLITHIYSNLSSLHKIHTVSASVFKTEEILLILFFQKATKNDGNI